MTDGTRKAPGGGGSAAVPDTAPARASHDDDTEDFDAWLRQAVPRPSVTAFGQRVTAPAVVSLRLAARWADLLARREDEPVTVPVLRAFIDDLFADDTLSERLYQGGADANALFALVLWGMANGRGHTTTLADCYARITGITIDDDTDGDAAGEAGATRGATSAATG